MPSETTTADGIVHLDVARVHAEHELAPVLRSCDGKAGVWADVHAAAAFQFEGGSLGSGGDG